MCMNFAYLAGLQQFKQHNVWINQFQKTIHFFLYKYEEQAHIKAGSQEKAPVTSHDFLYRLTMTETTEAH